MADPAPPSALREWRAHLRQPGVVFGCLGVGVIVALVAPFGTDRALGWIGRLLYWPLIVSSSYGIGALISMLLSARLDGYLRPPAIVALSGIAIGLAVLALVTGLNALVFGLRPTPSELPLQAVLFVAIALIVSALLAQLRAATRPEASATQSPPPLLERLPLDKRGTLLALSVEDHYVRVQTDRGEEMVLMRLSDAIREAGSRRGLRVHRSHWVALDAVTRATRRGDGARLTLSSGAEIPVSRANMAAIREAGLLPK